MVIGTAAPNAMAAKLRSTPLRVKLLASVLALVFAVTAILLVAAIVLSASLKEVPLRLVSGNQARAQANGDEGAVTHVAEATGPSAAPELAWESPVKGDAGGR